MATMTKLPDADRALAHRIAAWIRANPRELLGMVEQSGVTA